MGRLAALVEQFQAQALRQAALSLLRKPQYRHPFYSAGFVLVGDGEQGPFLPRLGLKGNRLAGDEAVGELSPLAPSVMPPPC